MRKNLVKRVNNKDFPISKYLMEKANEAFNNRNYLESAIIYFQTVDGILRIAILFLAEKNHVSKKFIKSLVEGEDRFNRLIIYLELLIPDNSLYDKLIKYNKKRNVIFHDIYSYKSPDSLQEELKLFCNESKYLIVNVAKLLNEFANKRR